jgi:hypothetical protein
VPRISALLMLRSTTSTVSAPATCLFRGSITNPTQLLCTLRGRRYRRLTQHLLPGGPLRPYPDRSCTGWTAPAFVGAFGSFGASFAANYVQTQVNANVGRFNLSTVGRLIYCLVSKRAIVVDNHSHRSSRH